VIKAGDSGGYAFLGHLLARQPGREAEAERAYQDAIAKGHVEAFGQLGYLLAIQGREPEAEQAWRKAIETGDWRHYENLMILLAHQPEGTAKVERLLDDAIAAGVEGARKELGRFLWGQLGREHDAEHAFRQAFEEGDAEAAAYLGSFLADQPGREADAEQAYRDAIAAGVHNAREDLAVLLNEQGREQEAEQVLQDVVDEGEHGS
jgi:Flp pilus assembly protein TadD